ncbi:HAD hydrolase, subfamily IA [Sphaerochaeta pleomorpha str. Grapes]|uniref:HAD hydrolase, subfamily IA n=1 Tax=Sphaerochaeta pleomorpha (strain ATCC BAA-1885 / DSM 22778 / Grapes) TaxID=158190 RepID=G8QU29_SPHPG|nr:YjjG family noncanonical pyrimidine nucleotidase [Sphaerochaeta pleomorpha]AEV30276.1 HAD hydrolase, subfamily IA [Sphaerochaeta pleomorpha str. Grapes]
MYRNLFFDADGTLFDFSLAEKKAFSLLSAQLAFPDTKAYMSLYMGANAQCWREFEQGTLTLTELKTKRFRDFSSLAGLDLDCKEASTAFEDHLSRQGILFQDSIPLLEALSKRGYHLFLASNGISHVQRGRIAASAIEKYFEGIFISEELGFQKPDTRFFEYMLEKANLTNRKEECIMIGDSLSSDIKGGIDSNIDTLWVNFESKPSDLSLLPTYECSHLGDLLEIFLPIY